MNVQGKCELLNRLENCLRPQKADYGETIVKTIANQLVKIYGNSFSEKNLRRMIQFAQNFPDKNIVVSLIRQLSWTHIITLIPITDYVKRDFYIEMCKLEKWSTRILRDRINSMLYERTVISKKPEATIKHDLEEIKNDQKLSPDFVFHDPYFLDFLGLSDKYSEKDLESAILRELQKFIIEFGTDFAFLARQKRITIDNEDYYIDLLFFHRKLKCLVAIDLKLGKFKAEHKGQMELYLSWLEKYDKAGEGKHCYFHLRWQRINYPWTHCEQDTKCPTSPAHTFCEGTMKKSLQQLKHSIER